MLTLEVLGSIKRLSPHWYDILKTGVRNCDRQGIIAGFAQ
jgi:hypothetical protein